MLSSARRAIAAHRITTAARIRWTISPRMRRMMSNVPHTVGKLSTGDWLMAATQGVLIGTMGCLLLLDLFRPVEESEADGVVRAFEEGRGWKAFRSVDEDSKLIDRPDLAKTLTLILQPDKEFYGYAMLVGEMGTGKSTAIRKAIAALEQPRGIVYLQCRPCRADEFLIDLARLIGCHNIGKGGNQSIDTFCRIVRQPLLDAAAKFRSKHGRPMVLVIDEADYLARDDPDFLEILQGFAKTCSNDMGTLRIVFVFTEDSSIRLMESRDGVWRNGIVHEIGGDIPDDAAVDYLKGRGVQEDEAKLAVANLTGGSVLALNQYATTRASWPGEKTYEVLLKTRDNRLENVLRRSIKLTADHPVFKHLIKHKIIEIEEILALGITSLDQLNALLDSKILYYHPGRGHSFYDRHAASWFKRRGEQQQKQAANKAAA